MPVQTIQNLLIVDPFVVDYRSLIQQVPVGTQVFILDGANDGVEQIAAILAKYKDLASVQILSHGSAGSVQLGASTLNLGNLQAYQDQLQQWGKALSKTGGKTGDILLYGCDVASGDGVEFVKQLSEITGADVAASNDLTGNAALGGDWNLEVQTGAIATPEVLDPVGMAIYAATLGTPAIGIAKLNDGREDPQNSQNALFKLSFSEALTQALTLNLTAPAMYSSTGTNVVGTARRTGVTTSQTIADQKASDYRLYWRYKGDADTTRNYIDGSQITLKSGDGVGNTEVYVGVEIFDDAIFEPTETVTVGLAAGTGYTVNTANSGVLTSAVVNILDNEPIISITKVVNPSEGYGAGSTLVGMGKALELQGNQSTSTVTWVQVAPSASLNLANTNKFTLEFWTSVNTLPTTDYRLVGYDDNSFKISLTKDGYISVSMKTADGKTVNLSSSVANQKLSLNTWSHIAATYDGSALRLFVNGQELGLDSQSDRKIAPTTGNLTFGDPNVVPPYLLWLDEVRLWNQNRSQGQVQQNILTNFKGDENGLVGYWKLDGDALDSTSFQNNAVITTNNSSLNRGLSLAYFNDVPQNITFQGAAFGQQYTRLSGNPVGGTLTGDNAVSLNVNGSPALGVNVDQFSARWAGYIIAPKSGNYSFNVTTGDDEGVRVSIDNSAIIDRWSDVSRSNYPSNGNFGIRTYNSTRDVFLEEGKLYPIAVDFFDVAGTATLQLNWSAKDTNGNLFIDNQPIGKENFRPVSNFIENPVAQIGYVEVQSTDISGNPLAIDQGNGLWVPYDITGGTATRLPLPNPTTGAITATNVDYYNSQFQVTSTNAATRLDGIVIPQGESTGRIYFGAIADAIAEGDETIIVKIKPYNIDVLPATPNSSSNSNVTTSKYGLKDSNGNLVDNLPATVTIKDNGRYVSGLYILDTNNRLIGTLQKLSSGAASFTTLNNLNVNTGSADVQVRLSSQPLSNVTVAIAGKTLTFTSANWETPQTVTLASPNLSQFNDTNGSPFAGFNISLSNTSNTSDYTLFSTPVTIPVGVPREDLLPLTEDPRAFTQPAVIPEVSIIAKDILVEDEPLVPANFVIRLSDPAPTGGLPVAFNITSSSTASLGIDYKLQATLIKTTQNLAPSTNLISSLGTVSSDNSGAGNAFDASTTTYWAAGRGGGYLQYQFPSGQSFVLTEYRLTNTGNVNPTSWTFQGSNDGINFTTIDQRSGETFSGVQVRSFAVSNTNAYQYYRINLSDITRTQVAEFALFGRPATTTPTYTYTYQVIVPAGATSLEIPVFAINDSINEVPETIQFEVQPADNANVYRVNSTQKSATMTLLGADRPGIQFASASFTSQFKEFKAIDPTVSPLKGITAQGNLSFADLDRDKDIDAFVVQADGKIRYFENTDSSAQKNSPQFVENATKNPFNTITVAGNSQLLFDDLDHDTRGLVDVNINGVVKRQLVQGDLDAVVINPDGTTQYYQNNDSSDLRNTPNYQLNATANPFGNINGTINVGVNANVVLDDIDADGDEDAFAVQTDGTVVFYENTDSTDYKTQPKYQRNDAKNPFANIKLGAGSNLAFADINGDGSDDAYNIKADGTVDYYKSSGVSSGITIALNNDASPLKGITVGNGKLQFVDINGDGDRDGVVRKADGSLVLYDNTTQPKAVFGQAIQSVTTSENGDSVTFGVRLSSQPVQNVTLQFLNPKTTEHSFDKTSLIFTPDNWNQYQAVKVTGVDDAIVDGDIQYSVTLQGTDGDPGYKGVNNLLLMTNKDNDKPVVQGSVQPIGDNTQPQVSATPVYPIVPESLSIKATSGFKATNGNTGTLELIVKFPTGTNNTYSSFLLEGGTIISFDNPTNPLFPTKFQVLEDTVIQNAVGVGIAVRVNLYQGNAGDLTIDNTGAFGFGVIQPAKAPATGKFQISLDRPVEYPIQVLSGFDSTTGLVTVRLNRILGTTPDSYVLKQGSLLRIGDAEAKVLQDTPLTNAASGVVVNVSLNKGTAIAANSIGTALPWVKVNFDLTGLTLLNSLDPTFTVGNIPGLTSGFVGLNARTVFSWGDLNGDGKPDAIAGNSNGTFNFIKNTSSGSTISFDGTDNSLFQSINKAITDANTSSTTNTGVTSYSMPALVDIDNDGDLDLFVGVNTASGGQLLFYRNVGTKLNPIFNRDDAKNPFNGTIFGKNVAPTFGDIDKDGKPDLIIGSQSNSTNSAGLRYYLNTSYTSGKVPVYNLQFTQTSIQSSEADSYFGAFPVIDNAIPILTDFDRDGKLDLVVKVNASSQIRYFNGQYVNVPNTNNAVINGVTYHPVTGFWEYGSPFSAITATEVNPSLVDLNGDGFVDLFLGKYNNTSGDNYAYILNQSNQVKAGEIKPGETTGYVTVSPIDDSIQLSDRTVQLTLKNGDNYRLKTTNSLNLGDYLKDPTNQASLLNFPTAIASTQTVPIPNSAKVSNNLLQLTSGVNQIGEVFLSQPRTLSNDYGFSTQFQLQVSGVTGTTNPATVALLIKSDTKTYSLPLASQLTNGTWNVWVDYNGLTDNLEVRYSQTATRPDAANILQTVSKNDLVGNSTNAAVQVGFRATTNAVAVTNNLLNLSFRDTYNPNVDRVQFPNFASTTGLTLSGTATSTTSNSLSVLRLNSGTGKVGQFVRATPLSVENDGSFSEVIKLQVTNTAPNGKNGRFSLMFGGSATSMGAISLDNQLAVGTWTIWVDYDGSKDLMEVRLGTSDTRPASAFYSIPITKSQILGSDASKTLYLGLGGDTSFSYTDTQGTLIDLRQTSTQDVISWSAFDDYNPQSIDPATQLKSFSSFPTTTDLAIAANTDSTQVITVNTPNAAKAFFANGSNVLRLSNGADQIGQVNSPQPIRFAVDGSFSSFFKVQVSGAPTNTATLNLLLLSTSKEYSLPVGAALSNGTWNMWLDYNGNNDTLELRYSNSSDRPATANVTQTVGRVDLMGNGDTAQIGFRAITNAASPVTYDLLDWRVLNVYDPQAYVLGNITQKFTPNLTDSLTVVDDDRAGVLIYDSNNQLVTSSTVFANLLESGSSQTFTVKLNSQPNNASVQLTFATNNKREGQLKIGNAASKNSVSNSIFLNFTSSNWNQAQSFTVVAQNDAIDDGDIKFQIVPTIASADKNYASISLPKFNFTTVDDDSSGLVANGTLGDRVNIIEGVTDAIALKLASQPSAATQSVRVTVSPIIGQLQLNGNDAGASDTLTFTASTWNQEQTIRVNAIDDNVVEGTQKTKLNVAVERTISYDKFTDLSELLLTGATAATRSGDTVLRLAEQSGQTGTVFYKDQAVSLYRNEKFSSFFRFAIDDPSAIAEGISLVVSSKTNNTNNPQKFMVHFNPKGNQLLIESSGAVQQTINLPKTQLDRFGNNVDTRLNNGQLWSAWVDYDGTTDSLQVRLASDLNRPSKAIATYTGLKAVLGNSTSAYIGLSATNSTSTQTGLTAKQDVVAWTIDGNDPAYNNIQLPNSNVTKIFRDADPTKVKVPFDVEIRDNDLPTASLKAGPKALEVKSPSYFTVSLDNIANPAIGSTGLAINYQLLGGSATNNQDYQQIPSTGVIRVAPGEIQSNLLVFPIDDFIAESTDFQITNFDRNTNTISLKITDKIRIYENTNLTFGKSGSNEGAVGQIIFSAGATVLTDPDTNLRYIEVAQGSTANVSVKVLTGTLALAQGVTSGVQAAPLVIQTATATTTANTYNVGLQLGNFNLINGSTLELAGGIRATVIEDKSITNIATSVKVTLNDGADSNQIKVGNTASLRAENLTLQILPGTGYQVNPNSSKATLEIADNDVAGVRIIPIGDRPVVQESGNATKFQIALLSEPQSPVIVYLQPDKQISVDNLNPPLLDAQISGLSLDKTTGNLQLRLFRKPSSDVTIDVTPQGSATPLKLIFTTENWDKYQTVNQVGLTAIAKLGDVYTEISVASDGNLQFRLLTQPTSNTSITVPLASGSTPQTVSFTTANWNTYQKVTNAKLDRTLFSTNVSDSSSTLKNYNLRFQDLGGGGLSYVPNVGKGFYSVTFDATNWWIPQDVTISAIDNNKTDATLRDGVIKYGIVSGDPNYAALSIADQSIGIVDRAVDAKKLNEGIKSSLANLRDSVNDFSVPVIGKLKNDPLVSQIFNSLSDALDAALANLASPTATSVDQVIEAKLDEWLGKIKIGDTPIFGTPEVKVETNSDEITFTITLAQSFTKQWKLDSKMGLDAIGLQLSSEGSVEVKFDYNFNLVVGVNKDFGAYVNTDDTGLRVGVSLGLTPDFGIDGKFGFFQLGIANSPANPTEARLEGTFTLADPDNINTIKFFDVNGNQLLDTKPYNYNIPQDTTNQPKTLSLSIQEPFTEINGSGVEQSPIPVPEVVKTPAVYQLIDWNQSKSFDDPNFSKREGIYRTVTPTTGANAGKKVTYFDANRNGKLDINELSTTDPQALGVNALTGVNEFAIRKKPAATPAPAKPVTSYYFDANFNGKYDVGEDITAAQKKQDKNNSGILEGDSNQVGEGQWVQGRGIAYRDVNNNGVLDLETFTDANNNGVYDAGETFIDLNGNKKYDGADPVVYSDFTPVEVNDDGLARFVDVNNDGIQSGLVSSDRPDPQVLAKTVRDDSFYYVDLEGDLSYLETDDPAYKLGGFQDIKIVEDATNGYSFFDVNRNGTLDNNALEPLKDDNGNGKWDTGETYFDVNGNGKWDASAVEAIANMGAPYRIFFDMKTNGAATGTTDGIQKRLLDKNGNGLLDTGETETDALIQPVDPAFLYIDANQNNAFESTEQVVLKNNSGNYYFIDNNKNGKVDEGDIYTDSTPAKTAAGLLYLDANNNHIFDSTEQAVLKLTSANNVIDTNLDGKLDGGDVYTESKLIVSTGSDFFYLDTNADGHFNALTEKKVLKTDFGYTLDENNDGLYNKGEAAIVNREGIVRTDSIVGDYVDFNNDGKFTTFAVNLAKTIGGQVFPNDAIIKSDANGLYIELGGQKFYGQKVDFLDLQTDSQYGGSDIRVGTTTGTSKIKFYDKDKNGTLDPATEPVIRDVITYLDINSDQNLNANPVTSVQGIYQSLTSQNSNSAAESVPDPREPKVLIDAVGARYLDLNFNGDRDAGEPFSKSNDEPMRVDPAAILTFDIVKDGTGKRFLDRNGDGQVNAQTTADDTALDAAVVYTDASVTPAKTATLAELLGIADTDTSLTFLDVNGDRNLQSNEYAVFTNSDGWRYVDIKRDHDLNVISEKDVNSDGVIAVTESGFESEPIAKPNNNFDALVTRQYQPARSLKVNGTLTNQAAFYYYDLNRNGQFDTLSDLKVTDTIKNAPLVEINDDGARLTALELLQAIKDKTLSDIFQYEIGAKVNVGLTLKAGVGTTAAWPTVTADLAIEVPIPIKTNKTETESPTTTIEFKNVQLDLGTFLTNFVKPYLDKVNQFLDPIRPIVDFLTADLQIPSKLGLDGLLDRDGKPGINILEVAQALSGMGSDSLTDNSTSTDPNAASTPKKKTTAQKLQQGIQTAAKYATLLANVTDTIQELNNLVQNSNSVILNLGDWSLGGTEPTDSDPAAAISKPKEPVKPADPTKTNLSAPENAPNLDAKTKSLFQKIAAIEGLKFPVLTDFTVPLKLLLGQSGVDLVTFTPPNLAVGASFDVSTYVWDLPPVKVGVTGSLDINANLSFGFDTYGVENWIQDGANASDFYKVLDGLYVGATNPIATVNGSLAAYGSIDALLASLTIEGGIDATVNLDLIDEGANNGTSDGKVRFSDIIAKIQRAAASDGNGFAGFLSDMFRLYGSVEAFIKAEASVALIGTVWSAELARLVLYTFSIGGGQNNGLAGTATQSYIQGATVFWDANLNGVMDANEPHTITNADGSYLLDVPVNIYDTNANGRLDAKDGQLTLIGGIDQVSGQTLQTPLLAVPESQVISPLTTLKAVLTQQLLSQNPNLTADEALNTAEIEVKRALGLPQNINLNTFNPILEMVSLANPDAAIVYQKHVQVEALLSGASRFLEGVTGKSGTNVSLAAITAIAKGIATARGAIDLTNSLELADLFGENLQSAAQSLATTPINADRLNALTTAALATVANGATITENTAAVLKIAIAKKQSVTDTLSLLAPAKVSAQTLLPSQINALSNGDQHLFLKDVIGDKQAAEGTPFSLDLSDTFGDTTNSPITLAVAGLPTGFSFNPTTKLITGNVKRGDLEIKPYKITVTATNAAQETLTGGFDLNVSIINQAPTIFSAIATQNAIQGQALTLNVAGNFKDVDANDVLTFTATGLPANFSLSSVGVLTGTPSNAEVGTYTIKVVAKDQANSASPEATFTLNVANVNDPPQIVNAIAPQKATQGQPFTLDIHSNFTDIDVNDSLSFTASGLPDGLNINNVGIISGTPTNAGVGDRLVTVTATDKASAKVNQQFTLSVANINDAPTATDDNATTTTATTVNIDVLKNDQDIDKDPLTLSILTLPLHGKATVNNNNTPDKKDDDFISYLPVAAYTGSDSFTYQIDDGKGGKASAKVNIAVNAVSQNGLIAGAAGSNFLQLNGNNLTKLEATLINKQVKQFTIDEVGVFAVDDAQGRVNGLLPTDSGYLKAALQKAQVIFSVLPDDLLSSPNRILQGLGGQQLAFYLVQNGTTDEVLRDPNAANKVRFGSPINGKDLGTLKLTSTTANQFTLAFDDGLGSDRNPDITLNLKLTDAEVPIGSNLQGSNEQEIVDLTQFKGQKIAAFFPTVASEAAYDNVVGFYRIENKQGSVFDPLTGKTINVGDADYTQAAIRNSQSFGMNFNDQSAGITKMLDGGSLFAPFIIANGNVNQVLNSGSGNQPAVYFSYLGANSDKVDHIRLLGSNAWGFEDLAGGGDRDYNDIIIRANFKPVA